MLRLQFLVSEIQDIGHHLCTKIKLQFAQVMEREDLQEFMALRRLYLFLIIYFRILSDVCVLLHTNVRVCVFWRELLFFFLFPQVLM